MIRQTSILAYKQLEAEGKLGKQSYLIYMFFKNRFPFTYTRNDIKRLLNLEISSVTGRINGLIKSRWLVEIGKTRDPLTKKLNMIIQWNKEFLRSHTP